MNEFWTSYNLSSDQMEVSFHNECGEYPHVRDLLGVAVALRLLTKKNGDLLKILDFGSNLAVYESLKVRLDVTRLDYTIYDPFTSDGCCINDTLRVVSSLPQSESFDFIYLGSVIQYLDNLGSLRLQGMLRNFGVALITHTPLLEHAVFTEPATQKNHQNVEVFLHSISQVHEYFGLLGCELLFKGHLKISRDKYEVLDNKFALMNLMYEKIN